MARNPICQVVAAQRRLLPHREPRCDHLHETTTRYDHPAKRLDFLLACPICGTEQVIHSLDYEPRFEPAGATVRALRPGDATQPSRRAA